MDAGTGLAFVGEKMLDPPKWFYGGEYGAGGVVDWSNVLARGVVDSMEATGEAPPKVIKYYATGTTIYIAVMDSKVLLEDAEVLSETNIEDNTKVGLIVLDGAMKISKLVDPTGYFSNLGDGTVGKVVQLAKKISDRSQGYFEWEGRILHQESDGNYVDIHTNEKFSRAGGGFFSSATFVPVTEGGSG
jgi:hypothetical protein